MNEKVRNHFKFNDPILFGAIRPNISYALARSHDPFTGLCRIIIGQQVSTHAARSIFERFRGLFPRRRPTIRALLQLSDEALRSAGLSQGKVRAIRDLADHIERKAVSLTLLPQLPDEEVIAALIMVHGIGRWSAEMFLIFYLGREDVFSDGDLGLRTAIKRLYRLRKPPNERRLASITKPWAPYRSYACKILWESLNNNPQL